MREYGPSRPLVFNHIPKTAGSSLHAALRQSLAAPVSVGGLDLSLVGGYDNIAAVSPAARTSFYFKPEELPADATLVAGHISPGTTMARYPDGEHITLLRVPQLRLISAWLHGRSLSEFDLRHWGPSADAFRVARLPLADYLQHAMIAPNVDNTITRFLAWPHPLLSRTEFIDEAHDEELLGAAHARLDAFAHVDITENPRFIADLGTWLGRELPETRANERTSVPPRRRPDIAAELAAGARDLLDYRSRLDTQVWARVARRVRPDHEPGELLESAIAKSMTRYAAMIESPAPPLTKRRVVEGIYGVGVRLDPRRRSRIAAR